MSTADQICPLYTWFWQGCVNDITSCNDNISYKMAVYCRKSQITSGRENRAAQYTVYLHVDQNLALVVLLGAIILCFFPSQLNLKLLDITMFWCY